MTVETYTFNVANAANGWAYFASGDDTATFNLVVNHDATELVAKAQNNCDPEGAFTVDQETLEDAAPGCLNLTGYTAYYLWFANAGASSCTVSVTIMPGSC